MKKMGYKLNFPILGIDGKTEMIDEEGNSLIASKIIGNALFRSEEKTDPIRVYELAKKVYYADDSIDLNASEIELIKSKMSSGNFSVLILAPVFVALSK
jgi:hypothetical protein